MNKPTQFIAGLFMVGFWLALVALFVVTLLASVRDNALVWLALVGAVVLSLILLSRSGAQQQLKTKTLGELLMLTPSQFEDAVADLLQALGYRNVKRVGGAGDLAADITCKNPKGQSVIVQCKRYAPGSAVGSPAIQQFIGMQSVHHKADVGLFVTTARFTRPAIELANQHHVALIDGAALTQLLLQIHKPPVPVTIPRDDVGTQAE